MKKIIKTDYAIMNLQSHICGIFFYTIEYYNYLLNNNFNIYLITSFPKSVYNFYIKDKYDIKKLNKNFFENIIYIKKYDIIFDIKNLIILDYTTFYNLKEKFIFRKLFYNYGNDLDSLNKTFYEKHQNFKKKVITFGDKELGLKVDYHYPLCLDFSIFKEIENFLDNTFYEKKDNKILNRKRGLKDFHKHFNKYVYDAKNLYDRANRLIPECKFYNKEIELINYNKNDSISLRYNRSWKDYDLNNFISSDTNLTFAQFLKSFSV